MEITTDGANDANTVQEFLDAEFGDKADIHICGICKLVFADIDLFVEHKRHPCGGFLIASVKSLRPRGYGRAEKLEDASSLSCEVQEASGIQEMGILASNESLSELSHVGTSTKCATEANESPPSLLEVNLISNTVTIPSLPCVELEINSGNEVETATPTRNPVDQQLSILSVSAGNLATTVPRTSIKSRKGASKLGKLRKYACDHPGCEYACAYPKDLTRHLRIHSGEQPFECSTCKKKFNRSDKLRLHIRSHTGEKPYICNICKYTTSDHSSLNKHLRIHTGEKPYKCQICPYASRNSSQLVVHLRTHTLDAPYSCKICQRAFKISTDLKRHEHLHTGEKPFKCDACDYKCALKGNLKMHFRLMHSTENMQKCHQCDFSTASRKAIRQHLKLHEPKYIPCPYPGCAHSAKTLHPISIHVLTCHKDEPFRCIYCLYSPKQPAGSVCKHVKRYCRSSPSPIASETNGEMWVGQIGKTADGGDVGSNTKNSEDTAALASPEGKTSSPKSKPKKRLSKSSKRAIVCKPLCVPHFECHICPAAFVREDSLRSHLRQHRARNDSQEAEPKIATENHANPDNGQAVAIPGSAYSSPSELTFSEMDGFQPVLEAISDGKEQVIEQALRQSGILCLQQLQSSDSDVGGVSEFSDVIKDTVSVQESNPNAVVPIQSICPITQDESGQLVYEVQHCFLVPFDSSVVDTTQYIVQATPENFVQFMNSTLNADDAVVVKGLDTICADAITPDQTINKTRPIMPKPQANVK